MWMDNEDQLVADVLEGRHSSFEILLRPYRQKFLTMAYRITGNREDAKEVCQEALLRIFKYLRAFQRGRSFKTWAYKVLMNTSYDFLRDKKKFERVIESQKNTKLFAYPTERKKGLNSEIKEKIKRLLEILTPAEKSVFLLRDGEGLSVEETSLVLGCSRMSVRTHLCRARKKMKDHFERFYPLKGREEKP